MDPVGSTYSDSTPVSAVRTPLIADAGQRKLQDAVQDGGASAAGQKQSDAVRDKQLGVQRSESSGGSEFQPYGPDGKRPAAKPSDSSAPQQPPRPPRDKSVSPSRDSAEQDPQVQQQLAQLKAAEVKVKAHEAAHKAAGGSMTGPISYTYTRGPDGKSYVTGGEVPISVSPGKTPQETITRMQQVIQAALAPADPSPQDRAVAGQAGQELQKAQQERSSSPATATGSSPGSTSAPTESKDTAQTAPGSPAEPAATTSPSTAERQPRSDNGANGSVGQASRAYGDPAVSGSRAPNRDTATPTAGTSATERVVTNFPAPGSRQDSFDLTPAMITGFGAQPLSRYA